MASAASRPHISGSGRNRRHTSGRSASPKSRQRPSGVNCTQRTPAGFPRGIPGMGLEMEGATQQAPHPTRHSIAQGPSGGGAEYSSTVRPSGSARAEGDSRWIRSGPPGAGDSTGSASSRKARPSSERAR